MSNQIYENFKMYFPYEEKRVVSWRELDTYAIVVKTDEGKTFMYDDLDRYIRRLPDMILTEEEYKKEFGRRLRRLLNIKQITQSELSNMTGIPQSQISKYVNGQINPTFYAIDKIAKVLRCSADDLRCVD